MSIRNKTWDYRGEKFTLGIEYNLTNIRISVGFANSVGIKYADNKGMTEYEISSRLLTLYYKLLGLDIKGLERKFNIKISSKGITNDKGEQIHNIEI